MKGFSLLELLLVVAALGIVVAIILMAFVDTSSISCDVYKNSNVANLPVRCLDYYQVRID